MKFTSQVMTKASGSAAGITASRNKGGMYFRGRAVPINRNTARQQIVKAIVASLVTAWQTIVTATQRAGWATYASNVTKVDKLGASIKVSGNNWYMGNNTPRLQAALARVDDAPTTFNTSSLTPPSFTYTASSGHLVITFDNGDDWATADGGALLLYISAQQMVTINFFKGPFAYSAKVEGNTMTPPTSPATITLAGLGTAGNQLFIRSIATTADGRLTAAYITPVTIL